jgi:PTS system nitrogen regulatory IIA component
MKITDYLTPELVVADLKAGNKDEVLRLLAGQMAEAVPELAATDVLNVLMAREALGSTGIGGGIAIPHGKLGGLENVVVLFARSFEGVDFAAVDGQPVHLIFLLLAPESAAGIHLKLLAQISRMLKRQELRDELLKTDTAEGLYSLIKREDENS